MVEIGRLMTAMITPFDERGRVNYEEAKRLALALIDSGNDGLVLSGSTGETPTLSRDEKLRLYSEVKGAVGDRAAIIAGTTTYDNRESVELSKEAERLPVDGLMLTVPSYNKPPRRASTSTSSRWPKACIYPAFCTTCPAAPALTWPTRPP